MVVNQLVGLPLSRPRFGLVKFVERRNRHRLPELQNHFVLDAEIVGVVVAGGLNEHFGLEIVQLRGFESHFCVARRELSQPALVLMHAFGEHYYGVAVDERVFRFGKRALVAAQRLFAVEVEAESRQQSNAAQELACQPVVLNDVGTGKNVRLTVAEGENQSQRVVQAVLMVRCHKQRLAFGGHILNPDSVNPFVENAVVKETQVTPKCLIYYVLSMRLWHCLLMFSVAQIY